MMRLLLTLVVLLAVVVVAQAAPSLTLAADRSRLAVGDTATLTLTLAVPSTDATGVTNATLGYTAPAGFSLVSATGPKLVTSGPATATWDGGSAQSNSVSFRVIGQTISVLPAGSSVQIPLGEVSPGETLGATVTLKRTS